MRLFIGIDIDKKLNELIDHHKSQLETEVEGRWIKAKNRHITLKFLGDCQSQFVPVLNSCLLEITEHLQPFKTTTTVFGCFPNCRRARIFWLGFEPVSPFRKLYNKLEESLEPLGFKREERDFNPHLTLARLKKPNKVDLKTINRAIAINQDLLVEKLVLFESKLSPTGADYQVVRAYKLSQPESH